MPLTCLDLVDEAEALALVGPDAEMFTIGGAVVGFGAAEPVIIADAVDGLTTSCVWNSREFRLHGSGPARLASRIWDEDPRRPVHVFVRLEEACIYLGTARPVRGERSNDRFMLCVLRLDSQLDQEVLDRVRPPTTPPGLPGLEWLDHVNTDRGKALELFVKGWFPATGTDGLVTDLPGSVPWALADFYHLAARHPAVSGRQNTILPASGLRPDNSAERLVFGVENQGCWTWSFPWQPGATDTDPTVWLEDDHPVPEQEPLSGFLLQFLLHEAALTAPYLALSHDVPRDSLPTLEGCLQRVPLRPFLSPVAPRDFLVAPGLVADVTADRDEDKLQVWIGAAQRSALHPLRRLDIPWRTFDG
ncbi:hypothetical protein [Streptomyces sp. NRRL WC-3549]|uniref:hypothetical protein n=1 Tax=Streptomyces sp. NRRL WC-3549 TaxID=1463925 RepID=UPI00131DE796|nr:hypothetical protein [Streptomyces sp. NRRL WC-3549]